MAKATQRPLIDKVRSYLKTRKTPATVEQIMKGMRVSNPKSSVARTVRQLAQMNEVSRQKLSSDGRRTTYLLMR